MRHANRSDLERTAHHLLTKTFGGWLPVEMVKAGGAVMSLEGKSVSVLGQMKRAIVYVYAVKDQGDEALGLFKTTTVRDDWIFRARDSA